MLDVLGLPDLWDCTVGELDTEFTAWPLADVLCLWIDMAAEEIPGVTIGPCEETNVLEACPESPICDEVVPVKVEETPPEICEEIRELDDPEELD